MMTCRLCSYAAVSRSKVSTSASLARTSDARPSALSSAAHAAHQAAAIRRARPPAPRGSRASSAARLRVPAARPRTRPCRVHPRAADGAASSASLASRCARMRWRPQRLTMRSARRAPEASSTSVSASAARSRASARASITASAGTAGRAASAVSRSCQARAHPVQCRGGGRAERQGGEMIQVVLHPLGGLRAQHPGAPHVDAGQALVPRPAPAAETACAAGRRG